MLGNESQEHYRIFADFSQDVLAISDEITKAKESYDRTCSKFRSDLEALGYVLHTFGNYQDYREVLIHSSVNPHQINERGEIDESLDPLLAFPL